MIELQTTQANKFKDAAREAECDENEARRIKHLNRVAKLADKPEWANLTRMKPKQTRKVMTAQAA